MMVQFVKPIHTHTYICKYLTFIHFDGNVEIFEFFISSNFWGKKEFGKKERAIYYLSKKFTPYEAQYTCLEKTCCVLTWVAQK